MRVVLCRDHTPLSLELEPALRAAPRAGELSPQRHAPQCQVQFRAGQFVRDQDVAFPGGRGPAQRPAPVHDHYLLDPEDPFPAGFLIGNRS